MAHRFIALSLLVVSLNVSSAFAQATWKDDFFPYRLTVKLSEQATGQCRLDLPLARIISEINKVSLEPVDEKTLAFDRAILVEPTSGAVVGGFKLVPNGAPLDLDHNFKQLASGKPGQWQVSTGAAKLTFEDVKEKDKSFLALKIQNDAMAKQEIKLPVSLKKDAYYLMDYLVKAKMRTGYPHVVLKNPAEWFFNEVPGSYYQKLPPEDQWVRRQVLYQADAEKIELDINCGNVGTAWIGDIQCTPVEWVLMANLPAPTESLHLYLVSHAGHFYVSPTDKIRATNVPEQRIEATVERGELANLNPEGAILALGDNVTAWTVPSYLPLRAETISRTKPATQPSGAPPHGYKAYVMRGQSTTLVLAIETAGTAITVKEASCDLPVKAQFQRIASLDLFDSYFPAGKRTETRFDPMVDLNFPLAPPDRSGVHLIACTLSVPADAKPGKVAGKVKLAFATQVPREKVIELPIELTVLSPSIKPMRHFGVIFGNTQLTAYFPGAMKGLQYESTTMARFHGYMDENLRDTFISRLSRPDMREPHKAKLVPLQLKYCNALLDFNCIPQGITTYSFYDYEVRERGTGKAPELANWNFEAYDKAIELALKRDVPYLTVWHTNGHLMDFFHLADGSVYSLREKPEDEPGPWHVLPRDEYLKLVGDYFETLCAHLETKGLADRALVVVDESDETTYQLMFEIRKTFDARPHARKMRWSHTTYKTSVYTAQLPDGKPIMDEVLDLPMPDNDEHFNFLDRDAYTRFSKAGKNRWVYYVETDHLNLDAAGLSTVITPLKLRNFGVRGWYCWSPAYWSIPYNNESAVVGVKYPQGQTVNPWLNPYNNHGHGAVSFFYPPDPRGPADQADDTVTPSYRLHMIRDGVNDRALLEVLSNGKDDEGQALRVSEAKLKSVSHEWDKLWVDNPVQWYLSPEAYRKGRNALYEACE